MTPSRTQRRQHGARGNIATRVEVGEAPCLLAPHYWDAPASDDMTREDRDRTTDAAKECRGCPSLAECLVYVDRWQHPDGVVAGQVWRDGKRLA